MTQEKPMPELVARLLKERWSIPSSDRLEVSFDGDMIESRLSSGASEVIFRLKDQGLGAPNYEALVNALDALFGQFEESGRAHRSLPSGSNVMFEGRPFEVSVERDVPELSRLADALLEQN